MSPKPGPTYGRVTGVCALGCVALALALAVAMAALVFGTGGK